MANPDMFISSPSRRATNSRQPITLSSSPELPSLNIIASQSSQRPQFVSPVKHQNASIANVNSFEAVAMTTAGANSTLTESSPQKSAAEIESRFFKTKKTNSVPSRPQQVVTIQGSSSPIADQGWKAFKKTPVSPTKTKPAKPLAASEEAIQDVEVIEEVQPASTTPPPKESNIDDTPLNLEVAPARRLDWTPPSKATGATMNLDRSVKDDDNHSVDNDEPAQRFDKLLDTFRMQDTSSKSSAGGSTDEESAVFRKRKLIECVTTKPLAETVVEKDPSPVKQKAPKKKARTITDLATAAYRTSEEAPQPVTTASAATKASNVDVVPTETNTAKGKKPVRKRATKAKKKKTPPPKPILLSPGAALKQVSNQDFVFGTSSQLAGDHSPTFLRDLAAAMRHSNQMDSIKEVTPLNSDAIEPPESRPSLWQAAARDAEGDLFDVEIQDIAQQSPELPQPAKLDDPFGYVKVDTSFSADDSFMNLSDIIEPLDKSTDSKVSMEKKNVPTSHTVVEQEVEATLPPLDMNESRPPNYEHYSDAQLAREVSSNGFKGVRARKARIELLEKCWQSKQQHQMDGRRMASTLTSTQSRQPSRKASQPPQTPIRPVSSATSDFVNPTAPDSQEPPPSAQPVTTPKRPRGRPRKAESALTGKGKAAATVTVPITPKRTQKTINVVEIPDSDSDQGSALSASSVSSPAQCFSSPAGVDLSVSMEEDADLSFSASGVDNDEPAVYGYIAKAIKSAPRSIDPLAPSWHEKILMYDPIIIEDLTIWLNSGQLTKAGYDDEVPTGEVKKWCEAKSVCCVWQTNLRGKERKRL